MKSGENVRIWSCSGGRLSAVPSDFSNHFQTLSFLHILLHCTVNLHTNLNECSSCWSLFYNPPFIFKALWSDRLSAASHIVQNPEAFTPSGPSGVSFPKCCTLPRTKWNLPLAIVHHWTGSSVRKWCPCSTFTIQISTHDAWKAAAAVVGLLFHQGFTLNAFNATFVRQWGLSPSHLFTV